MNQTSIEWTGLTWNPVTGCRALSSGCVNCYARDLSARYGRSFEPEWHPDRLGQPARKRDGQMVFVCSMADLLLPDFEPHLPAIAGAMRSAPQHTYQLLTKRPERYGTIVDAFGGTLPGNVWCGTTVEAPKHFDRVVALGKIPAAVRYLSVEPILSGFDVHALEQCLRANGIGWVIVGGESGFKARVPANLDWHRHVRDACALAGVPLFLKQLGGRGSTERAKRGGPLALLDGRLHKEWPRPTEQRLFFALTES